MTDVRLTATNPEDSSVVPVACNAKGELLLEEPTLASDDYVAVTGDNMTGDLTLGDGTDDKITLDATTGSATFAGAITNNGLTMYETPTLGGGGQIGWDDPTKSLKLYANSSTDSDATTEFCFNENSTPGITFTQKGSAEFAGDIDIAGAVTGGEGITLRSAGFISLRRDTFNDAFAVFQGGNGPENRKISMSTNGSASFAGDVVVGSRNKKWMLVEQNGLCHMVEQMRASTADLVEPVAAEYPPLRDVFAELDAIEKALGEVMDKLRMAPPAGWEVWDGSSENS